MSSNRQAGKQAREVLTSIQNVRCALPCETSRIGTRRAVFLTPCLMSGISISISISRTCSIFRRSTRATTRTGPAALLAGKTLMPALGEKSSQSTSQRNVLGHQDVKWSEQSHFGHRRERAQGLCFSAGISNLPPGTRANTFCCCRQSTP